MAQVFSCEFRQIFKKTFFAEHLQWLILLLLPLLPTDLNTFK